MFSQIITSDPISEFLHSHKRKTMKASSNPSGANESSRREFIKNTGKVTAAGALAGVALPNVHAQGSETVQVALIGCGGRGTGAAANALSVSNGPTKMVAMADVFQHRLDGSFNALKKDTKTRWKCPSTVSSLASMVTNMPSIP
jgi:hypothetical protein